MRRRATLLALLAIASGVAAAPPERAVITDSGSTNSYGYRIEVSSDGKGSVTLQTHGAAATTPKAFAIPAATIARFFNDLAAARRGNATTETCMKSASFGTSLHVSWQGWTSPDLTCPPKDKGAEALVADVAAIRTAAGLSQPPLHSQAGPIIESTPP